MISNLNLMSSFIINAKNFTNIIYQLNISGTYIKDDDLKYLSGITNELNLSSCTEINGSGL